MEITTKECGTLLIGIFKKAIPFVKSLKKQEQAIEDAAIRIINLLNDEQQLFFLTWINDLKLKTWSTFPFNNLDEAIGKITAYLDEELIYLDVSSEKIDSANNIIIDALLKYAKEDKPIDYITKVIGEISDNQSIIIKLLKRKENDFESIFQLDNLWKKNTLNPKIGIDFFSICYNDIKESLDKQIKSGKSFYISYYCREEAILMLCSYLKNMTNKKIYIVHNKETWDNVSKSNNEGCIFICDFIANDCISDIANNTCIYFVGYGERGINKETIEFRKRTEIALKKQLEDYKCDFTRLGSILEKTSGLFYPLKSLVWNGMIPMYNEYEKYKSLIKYLLIFPLFSKRDIELLKSIYGKDDFDMTIDILSKGHNPIIIKTKDSYKDIIYVADLSALWARYGFLIENGKDITNYGYVLSSNCSEEIKRGYLKSLALYVCTHEAEQTSIDNVLFEILNSFYNKNDITFGGIQLYQYVEASPLAVLKLLDRYKDKLAKFFKKSNEYKIFNEYVRISHALQQIIYYNKYSAYAYEITAYFSSIEELEDKNIHPKPSDIMISLFTPWLNLSGLEIDERIGLCSRLINNYNIIKSVEKGLQATTGPLMEAKDEIRSIDIKDVKNTEYFKLKEYLFDVLIEKINIFDLSKLLESLEMIRPPYKSIEIIPEKILKGISSLNDDDKYIISLNLRSFIYDVRFYERGYFIDKSEFVLQIENIINKIEYNDNNYNYLYVFSEYYYSFLLINPTPFDNDIHINDSKSDKVINDCLEIVLDENYNFINLLKLIKKYDYGQKLDSIIYRLNGDYKYNKKIATILCDNDLPNAAYSYVCSRNEFKGENLLKALDESLNPIYRALILDRSSLSPIINILEKENDSTKQAYWNLRRNYKVNDLEEFNYININLLTYSNISNWLDCLEDNLNLIGYEYVINIIYSNRLTIQNKIDRNSVHLLNKILKLCANNSDLDSIDALGKGAEIEILFSDFVENVNCLNKFSSYNSSIFSELCKKVYGNTTSVEDDHSKLYILINYKMRFCPGLINGKFENSLFNNWICGFKDSLNGLVDAKIISHIIGKLLGNSLCLDASLPLPEEVCEYITINFDDDLSSGLSFSLLQTSDLEIHTITDGSYFRGKSLNFINASKLLYKKGYYKISEIFEKIADYYSKEANDELENAINGRF